MSRYWALLLLPACLLTTDVFRRSPTRAEQSLAQCVFDYYNADYVYAEVVPVPDKVWTALGYGSNRAGQYTPGRVHIRVTGDRVQYWSLLAHEFNHHANAEVLGSSDAYHENKPSWDAARACALAHSMSKLNIGD